jgi:hypothetical protein
MQGVSEEEFPVLAAAGCWGPPAASRIKPFSSVLRLRLAVVEVDEQAGGKLASSS